MSRGCLVYQAPLPVLFGGGPLLHQMSSFPLLTPSSPRTLFAAGRTGFFRFLITQGGLQFTSLYTPRLFFHCPKAANFPLELTPSTKSPFLSERLFLLVFLYPSPSRGIRLIFF